MASPSPPAAFHPSRRLYLAFLSLAVLTLMVALDGTSISVALPTIATALHGTTIEAFWSGTAFLLCNTVFQPTFASLGYIFGRKQMTLVALSFFLAEALIAALARGFTLLLVGRSVQGVGGGGLVAITEIVLTDLVPLSKRGTYTGVIGSMYAIGGAAGPIIGGAFAQVGWRWIVSASYLWRLSVL
jgi:MFS family permease